MKIRQGLTSLFFAGAMFVATLFSASAAYADCSSPAGTEGVIIYNSDHNVVQFCNGTNWIAMVGGEDSLAALSCSSGQVAKWNGSAWACAADADTVDTNTDALAALSCSSGQVAKWNGSAWACAADVDTVVTNTDALAALSCSSGQVAKWNGSAWACAADTAGADNLGDHTATENIVLGSYYLSGDGGNEGIRIDSDGKVGVGTTTPGTALHVKGNGQLLRLEGTDHSYVEFYPDLVSGGRKAYLGFGNISNDNFTIANEEAAGGIFMDTAAAGTQLVIASNGNVGIGTATPEDVLDVVGTRWIIGSSRTDATPKYWRPALYNYNNADGQVVPIFASSGDTANKLILGGGTSLGNAMTQISFNTAPNTTTLSGTSRMFINSAGNVGIGTTSPTTKLDVNGVVNVNSNKITGVATPTAGTDAANKAYVDSAAANADTLDSINSTQFLRSDVNDTMSAELTVQGDLFVGKNGGGDARVRFYDDNSDAWRIFYWDDSEDRFRFNQGIRVDGNARFDGSNTGDEIQFESKDGFHRIAFQKLHLYDWGNGADNMVINNGKVAIGTDLDATFTITGETDISAVNTAGQGGLVIQTSATDTSGYKLRIDSNELQASFDNAATSFQMNPFGGSVNFGGDIVVNGSDITIGKDGGGDSRLRFYDDNSNTTRTLFWDDSENRWDISGGNIRTASDIIVEGSDVYIGQNGDGDARLRLYDDNSNTWRTFYWDDSLNRFRFNNHVHIDNNVYAAAYYHTSDIRLKDDVRDIDDPFALLDAIHGKKYVLKTTLQPTFGVIAQDVEVTMPEAVSANDDDGMKSVDYNQLIAPMVEAIKILKAENDALRQEVEALKHAAE